MCVPFVFSTKTSDEVATLFVINLNMRDDQTPHYVRMFHTIMSERK
jgi:hypothetical protein